MGPGSRGAACVALAALMSGCALFSPPLLTPRPVDPAPFAGVLAAAGGSVGRLLSTSCAGAPMAGSGFVVDDHHVLTASHVVAGSRQVSLRLAGAEPVLAEVVGIDLATDTALVRTSTPIAASPLALAGPEETAPGTEVEVLGFPLGDAELRTYLTTVTSASESAVVNDHSAKDLLVVDASLRVGMSGGPVVDSRGRVRGMSVASIAGRGGRDSTSPVALALPTGTLASRVGQWRDAGPVAVSACPGDTADLTVSPLDLVVRDGTDAELAHTLWLFGSSLDRGQFGSAWGMLTGRAQSVEGDLPRWTAANTARWTRLDVTDTTRGGEGATARTLVRTVWEDGTCRELPIGYTFRLVQGIWLIDTIATGPATRCR